MPKYYKVYLEPKSLAFSDIAVIQTVWDSTTLGYLQKGMFNITAEAIPEKNMTAFLQDYVTNQYKDYFKKNGKKILMVFKNLRVTEKTFFSRERAYALLNADAYISEDGTTYKLASSVDSVLIIQGGGDMTSLHGENICYGILELLKKCQANGYAVLNSDAPGLTTEQIREKEMAVYDLPVLKTDKLNEGAFMTYQEFLNNAPSITEFETKLVNDKTVTVFSRGSDNIKTEITPWAICKGDEIYRFQNSGLIPIERKGNGFVISDYLEKSQRRNQRVFFAGFFAGAIGSAIAAGQNPEHLFSVTRYPYIGKQKPDASAVDLKTGDFTF